MDGIVLMGDPAVAAVPVEECGEHLEDVEGTRRVLVDSRKRDPAGHWRRLRTGVAARLAAAAERLPDGLSLLLVEGYRPPELQARYFAGYRRELAEADPGLSDDELDRLASRFVSPPEVAPHAAGAAVDVTLCTAEGEELDLGTIVNASPEASAGACYTAASTITVRAREHRGILETVLGAAGFLNYPTEWWHWSYGDRYWALLAGHRAARYGTISPPG